MTKADTMIWHGQVVHASESSSGGWVRKAETALRHIHWFRREAGADEQGSSGSGQKKSMEPVQYNTSSSEYAQAMRSIRRAKNIFLTVLLVCLLVQIVVFLLVHVIGIRCHVLAEPESVIGSLMATQPASAPAAQTVPVVNWKNWNSWSLWLHYALPGTMALGMLSALLVSLSILFGVKIAILGRRPGLATMISSFFWSLIVLVLMVPWHLAMPGGLATGATFSLGDLLWWQSRLDHAQWPLIVIFYARFAGLLGVALLATIVMQTKFILASRAISGIPTISLMPEQGPGR